MIEKKDDGNKIALAEDVDKANLFAKTYKRFSRLPATMMNRLYKRNLSKGLKKRMRASEESKREITQSELDRVLLEASTGKAAGEDGIPYGLPKNLEPKAKKMLLHLYNLVWEGLGKRDQRVIKF